MLKKIVTCGLHMCCLKLKKKYRLSCTYRCLLMHHRMDNGVCFIYGIYY